jgi:preprotein translocase subunit YajC
MFGSLIDFIVSIILGSVLLVVAIYLQLRRRQQQRAELESHVKDLERRVSKLEESLKKQ